MSTKIMSKQSTIILALLFVFVGAFIAVWVMNNQPSSQSYDKTVTLDVDHPTYESVGELKNDATYIFTGTIQGEGKVRLENARAEDDLTDPSPFTDYSVTVDEVLKGEISDKTIIFSQLGGVNDRTLYEIESYPVLNSGERYIFFAIKGDGKYGALAGGYAVAPIVNEQFTLKEQTGIKLTQPLNLSIVK